MKYIMFQKIDKGMEFRAPFLFPNVLVHSDVAEIMTALGAPMEGWTPVSAGEYSPMGKECTGKSMTLGIASHPFDGAHLLMIDYNAMVW